MNRLQLILVFFLIFFITFGWSNKKIWCCDTGIVTTKHMYFKYCIQNRMLLADAEVKEKRWSCKNNIVVLLHPLVSPITPLTCSSHAVTRPMKDDIRNKICFAKWYRLAIPLGEADFISYIFLISRYQFTTTSFALPGACEDISIVWRNNSVPRSWSREMRKI